MIARVSVLLIAAHIIADYLLQTGGLIVAKGQGKPWAHAFHALTFGVLALILTLPWLSWTWALVLLLLTVSHMVVDVLKSGIKRRRAGWAFQLEVVDLFVHLLLIGVAVSVRGDALASGPKWAWTPLYGRVLYIGVIYFSAAVFATRGGTFIVRTLLEQLGKAPKDDGSGDKAREYNLGRMIGNLERLLILAFAVLGSYGAIGFVLAAKSIARFKELDDREFAEYYLVGTLASALVALATGWGVLYLRRFI
jgi:hypothetical protein